MRQFLVPTDAPGVRVESQRSIDLVKSYARVHFDGVEVDASAAVGSPEQTAELIARQSQIAQMLQCAEVVGILDAVLGLHHPVGLRPAFVRPTDRLLPGTQAQVRRPEDLVRGVQGGHQRRGRGGGCALPRARRWPSASRNPMWANTPRGMLQDCIQLHGGIGVTWEHDLHLFLRRVMLYRSMFGTPEEHNLRVYALTEQREPA